MDDMNNTDRAALARAAVKTFSEATSSEDDMETLITDLIGDLGHLAHAERLKFPRIVERAMQHWHCEMRGDETGMTDAPYEVHPIFGDLPEGHAS